MAGSENLDCITVEVGADLSANQYCAVKYGTGRVAVLAESSAEPFIGILQDKPAASGRAGQIGVSGMSKAKAGGTISSGDNLTATTGGKLIATTTNNHFVVGVAAEDAVNNDVFQIQLRQGQHGA